MIPKIAFFGQDWRSAIILEKLLKSSLFEIVAVVTLPDKPQGKKAKIIPNPVRQLAQKHQIPALDLASLPNSIFSADIGILASFGVKIPKKIIKIFPKGILVIHPSLLPEYRGVKPVTFTLLDGKKETGVTIIKMDEKFDCGPIIAQTREKISANETTESLEKKLFLIASKILVDILPAYFENKIKAQPQDNKKATYTRKLAKIDGKINWKKKAQEIDCLIRAMTPWPGAWTLLLRQPADSEGQAKRLKILKAHLENDKLILDQVQLEGKKPVTWKQLQEGYPKARIIKT